MAKTTKIRKFLAIALTLTLLFSLTSLSLSAAPRKECDCTCKYSCCEYGYDHSSRCQCDKCDEEEHEHGTSYSVNHIDIVVDMSATVTIDGEQKNIDFTISRADVNNNTVSVTPSVSGTAYSITGFGSDGTRDQIRINGNFPIGTQANPIRYTVSLTKTLTVDGVNVPVTLSATVGYWDNGNICPQGPRSNGALGGSQAGIDLELGNGSGSVNTQPTPSTPSTPSQPEPDPEPTTGAIQIQKTVAGAALAENSTFYFDIYDATGALFNDNVAVTVEANGTIALASVLNVPVGSYTVLEDALPTVEGYVLSGTAYSTANGSVAVNADTGYNGYVNVTNTYTAEEPPVVSSEPTVSSEPEVSSEPVVSSEPEVSSEP
ncbi:MAG: hypothetical protein IJC25_05595, partial [Clostridia bacterium]|nr:hypothetical protein [Clostridia bacterium]